MQGCNTLSSTLSSALHHVWEAEALIGELDAIGSTLCFPSARIYVGEAITNGRYIV